MQNFAHLNWNLPTPHSSNTGSSTSSVYYLPGTNVRGLKHFCHQLMVFVAITLGMFIKNAVMVWRSLHRPTVTEIFFLNKALALFNTGGYCIALRTTAIPDLFRPRDASYG